MTLAENPSRARAADRIRETGRWLLGIFGGVAVTLFASVRLSSVPEMIERDETARLLVTAIGYGLAVAGLLSALLATVGLAMASRVTMNEVIAAERDWNGRLTDRVRWYHSSSHHLAAFLSG